MPALAAASNPTTRMCISRSGRRAHTARCARRPALVQHLDPHDASDVFACRRWSYFLEDNFDASCPAARAAPFLTHCLRFRQKCL